MDVAEAVAENWVRCSCCGEDIPDTKEYNVAHDTPGKFDNGYGMCKECGGDDKATDIKKKMGWGMTMFVEARIETIAKRLNEENKKKFLEMPFEKQAVIVLKMVEKGAII